MQILIPVRLVTKICVVPPVVISKVDKLPRFGLVSPLKAQERRVRVVPIIGRKSPGVIGVYRSGVYPIVVFFCTRSEG